MVPVPLEDKIELAGIFLRASHQSPARNSPAAAVLDEKQVRRLRNQPDRNEILCDVVTEIWFCQRKHNQRADRRKQDCVAIGRRFGERSSRRFRRQRPARSLITTIWSSPLLIRSPTTRPIASVAAPGPNGRTIVIGWLGQLSAATPGVPLRHQQDRGESRRETAFMALSFLDLMFSILPVHGLIGPTSARTSRAACAMASSIMRPSTVVAASPRATAISNADTTRMQ